MSATRPWHLQVLDPSGGWLDWGRFATEAAALRRMALVLSTGELRRRPTSTNWSIVGFHRVACWDCAWNRNEHGEPMAGGAKDALAHAQQAQHLAYELLHQSRDFNGRPREPG